MNAYRSVTQLKNSMAKSQESAQPCETKCRKSVCPQRLRLLPVSAAAYETWANPKRTLPELVIFGANIAPAKETRQSNSTNSFGIIFHLSADWHDTNLKNGRPLPKDCALDTIHFYPRQNYRGVNQPLPFLSTPVATKCLGLGILPPWSTSPSDHANPHFVLVVKSGLEAFHGGCL